MKLPHLQERDRQDVSSHQLHLGGLHIVTTHAEVRWVAAHRMVPIKLAWQVCQGNAGETEGTPGPVEMGVKVWKVRRNAEHEKVRHI